MKRTADSIGSEKRFTGETLRTSGNTRAEQLRAVAVVMQAIPDRADRREVLNALFAAGRRALPPHGASPSLEYKAARKAWLARCRRWVVAQDRHPSSTQISIEDQRAYEKATGDVWEAAKWEAAS